MWLLLDLKDSKTCAEFRQEEYISYFPAEILFMAGEVRILLIEDDFDDRQIFQFALEKLPMPVYCDFAENGEEALLLIEEIEPPKIDVIFLDLNMPRMGGKEWMAEVRLRNLIPGIPIVVYSTSAFEKDINCMLQMGAVCFITKTADLSELTLIISKVILGLPDNIEPSLRTLPEIKTSIKGID